MITARISCQTNKIWGVICAVSTVALLLPGSVRATVGASQTCAPLTTCTIQDYFHDADNTQITSPTACMITINDPDGSEYVHTTMSITDGNQYYYEFTTPQTTGTYETQVCCTGGVLDFCIDKSFAVEKPKIDTAPPSTVASAIVSIWGYSNRTMSNASGLTGTIATYSRKAMSKFGNLIAYMWNYSSTSDNDPQEATNIADVTTALETDVEPEQIVNTSGIQNPLEIAPIDLQGKVRDSLATVDKLYVHHQFVHSKVGLIALKWDTLTIDEITRGLADVSTVLGSQDDAASDESVFGKITWLDNAWQWTVLDDIYNQAQAMRSAISTMQLSTINGKTRAMQKEIESIASYSRAIDTLIGENTKEARSGSLFGKLNSTKNLSAALTSSGEVIDILLAEWNSEKAFDIRSYVDTISDALLALNKIPDADAVLRSSMSRTDVSSQDMMKNELLSLKGLLHSNTILLDNGSQNALVTTWLEVGSVVFKSLLTNPSPFESQDIELTYYLPPEITKEDIVQASDGLSVLLDEEKNQLYVEGSFTVGPVQSLTREVRVKDKWVFSQEIIDSLRTQATELSQPLAGTTSFAQGVTIKSDIDVALNKALALAQGTITPDQKIRSFREAHVEFQTAQDNLDTLKELVTQVGTNRSSLGFIGGAKTLSTLGILIAAGIGFVFYMQYAGVLRTATVSRSTRQRAFHVITFLTFGILTATVAGITVGFSMNQEGTNDTLALTAQEFVPVATETVRETVSQSDGIEVFTIVLPQSIPNVNLRKHPNIKADMIYRLVGDEPVVKLGEDGLWVHIALIGDSDAIVEGWVHRDFLQEYIAATSGLLTDNSQSH